MRGSRYRFAGLPVAVLLAAAAMGSTAGASTVGRTYVVTTTADTNDGRCGTQCSLRDAILAANAHPGADIVRIPAGRYEQRIPGVNEDAGATGDLNITGPVNLVGAGQGRTILDGEGNDRVLSVRGDGLTRISGLTIRNGWAQINGGGGGGIAIDGSTVALAHVTVTNNAAVQGDFPDGIGGGIKDVGMDGAVNLTLTDVKITGNQAYFGGGISVEPGGATMSHVEISGNTAETSGGDGFGGGVYSVDSLTTIADSVIRNNWARAGGGGLVSGTVTDHANGLLRLTQVEVDGNITQGEGGGLLNFDFQPASVIDSAFVGNWAATGAVALNNGRLDVVNSTLNGNDSATGGVLVNAGSDPHDAFRSPGTGSLRNVTFADNSAGVENLLQSTTDNGTGVENLLQSTTDNSARVENLLQSTTVNSAGVENLRRSRTETIVNTILDNSGPNCVRDAGGGAIISTGGNLDSGRTCAFAAAGDRSGVNPRLAGLGHYGGQTLTRALQGGSPALHHGIDKACPSHDQRGVHRPQGPHCDIGAFEAPSSTP